METKLCKRCNNVLSLDNFRLTGKSYRGKKYIKSYCKKCSWLGTNCANEMIKGAKKRAKKKGLYFASDLTPAFLLELNQKQGGKCVLTGELLNWERDEYNNHMSPANRVSLDRIDPTKGYERDNIQLVIDIVNRMKNRYSYEKLIYYCRLILSHYDSR